MSLVTRRGALLLGAGLTLTLIAVDESAATPAETDAEIAENGNTVPMSIKIDSPMTAEDYVSEVLVVGDGNPNPGIVKFHLTAAAGRAEIGTRIRLNSTENVIVVAKTSTGKFYTERKVVKVTVGGCGG